jgi:hypothetical protein
MIPNIFVSSTIQDLQYLREAIRDTISSLGYRPLMSEFGDIGFLPSLSAEEACYMALKDCQIAIIILGKRYGWIAPNGMGITHNEFRTARENRIPIIFLIDKDIIAYKKVYDQQKKEDKIGPFPDMDSPINTFSLIEEFIDYPINNGFLPYASSLEATENIKKQLSHIFGNLLRERFDPLKAQVQDVLSEIKTLRHELLKDKEGTENYLPYLTAIRFLVDDENKAFSSFLSQLFKAADRAIPDILKYDLFDNFIGALGWRIQIEKYDVNSDLAKEYPELRNHGGITYYIKSFPESFGDDITQKVSWIVNANDKIIYFNELTKNYFDWKYGEMKDSIVQ